MRNATSTPSSRAGTTDRSESSWTELLTRHRAALDVIRSGAELDRELLLSYVVWPTEWMDAVTGYLLEQSAIAA